MGLDKPQKIKANAQGGTLAGPAWAAFMNQVYKRKPAPPDWPRPSGIITRTIDLTTNTLWTDGCAGVEGTEYFIPGTEPVGECTVHTPFGIQSPMDSAGANMSPPGQPPRSPRRDSTRAVPDPFRIPSSPPRRPDSSRAARRPTVH